RQDHAEPIRCYIHASITCIATSAICTLSLHDALPISEALAESYYMRGSIPEALVQLERVNDRDDLDYYQRSRVNARLNELRTERLRLTARQQRQQRPQ